MYGMTVSDYYKPKEPNSPTMDAMMEKISDMDEHAFAHMGAHIRDPEHRQVVAECLAVWRADIDTSNGDHWSASQQTPGDDWEQVVEFSREYECDGVLFFTACSFLRFNERFNLLEEMLADLEEGEHERHAFDADWEREQYQMNACVWHD